MTAEASHCNLDVCLFVLKMRNVNEDLFLKKQV